MKLKALCMVALLATKASGQPMYVYSGGEQKPDVEVIKYAAWDINERVGLALTYVGESTEGHVPGAITIRVGSFAEWENRDVDALATQPYAGDTGCQIVISPWYHLTFRLDAGLMRHELGHCAGDWGHSSDVIDTMYPIANTYGITQGDAMAMLRSPTWPPSKPPSLCHAVLTKKWEIAVPEVNGSRAWLEYQGNLTWKVTTYGDNPIKWPCSNVVIVGGKVVIKDVRSYPDKQYRAVFDAVGGAFRLIEVKEMPH